MKTFFAERMKRWNSISFDFLYKGTRSCQMLLLLLFFPALLMAFTPQEGGSGRRKAERERVKKERQADRKYQKDVKQHLNNQSKETKAMMKKSKRNSKKNTPVKPKSGKKCS
jgi:hypothetical protein